MNLTSPDLKVPQPKESLIELGRKKANTAWNNLSNGLEARTITPDIFLGETRTLVDHLYSLSPKEKKHVEKAFGNLRKHGKEFIKKHLKPVLIDQINSHTGKTDRDQDLKVAELLGLVGGKFGLHADKEVSQALGPESPITRKRLKTAATAVAGGAASIYYGPDTVNTLTTAAKFARDYGPEIIKNLPRVARGLSYIAQASNEDSELSAPQPIPNPKPAKSEPPPSPVTASSSPEPPPSPVSSPAASPEAKASPTATATIEPTKVPTNTPEPTPTPDAIKEKMVEIGDKNLAEFFLGGWIEELKGKGLTLWENDPSYKERVTKENAGSDNITLVYLGTDNERDRDRRANRSARSDVIMIEVFNPHTFKSTVISLNRDLLAPEGAAYGKTRINELTTLNQNPYPLVQRMLETATGLRIDGILQTNIDFVNGYDAYHDVGLGYQEGKNSVIDRLVPEGIEVDPPEAIDDPIYPKGYGTQHVHFSKGPQILHGQDLVRYARARKGAGNNDYMRSQRQREVGFKVFRNIASKLMDDLEQGKTDTLDLTVEVLKEQQEVDNLFQYDIDIVDMMDSISGSIKKILEMPNGKKIIAKLAANSMGNVATLLSAEAKKRYGFPFGDPEKGFTSYGLSSADGSLEDHPNPAGAAITRLRGSGAHISRQSKEGNFIDYWQPLRNKVTELLAA